MHARGPAPAVTLLALVLAGATGAACVRTKGDVQRDYARTLRPARLSPEAAAVGPLRALPVRVHADDDYRAQTLRWRERIEAQLERANQILGAQFGIRLVLDEIRPWSRSGGKGALPAALAALAEADPGDGAEWVIGFVASSELLSGTHEQLGMAIYFGRHLVLRGMASFEEGDALRRNLDALSPGEREELLRERQLHRETAVLLHEWAHTLGAFHERDDGSIMSPRYAPAQVAFSEPAARLVRLGLERRTRGEAAARARWAADYRAEVERVREAAWDEAALEQALSAARGLEAPASSAAGTARATPETGGAARAEPGGALLEEVNTNDRLGDPARAWKLLQPVASRFPERWQLQRYACHVRARALRRPPAEGACREAQALPPRAAGLLFARVLLEAGERGRAAQALARAEGSFAGALPPATPGEWAELAGLLAGVDACTMAERVAARAPAEQAARAAVSRCAGTRRRAALPAGSPGVEPAREPEYVDAFLRARARAARRPAEGRAAALALEASFPHAPGGPLVRCLAELGGAEATAIRAACTAADRAAPFSFEPVYVLGMVAGAEGRWKEARDLLRRALEREERERDIWERLGVVYGKLGEEAELDALDRRHRARFGVPLRPSW